MLFFQGCLPQSTGHLTNNPAYGTCKLCNPQSVALAPNEYVAGCDSTASAVVRTCLPRTATPDDLVPAAQNYLTATGHQGTLYCQVAGCATGRTGVSASGRFCADLCATSTGLCGRDEVALPCYLPHSALCLATRPEPAAPGVVRPRASTGLATPAHLNRLELPYDPAQQLVASFENVMLLT